MLPVLTVVAIIGKEEDKFEAGGRSAPVAAKADSACRVRRLRLQSSRKPELRLMLREGDLFLSLRVPENWRQKRSSGYGSGDPHRLWRDPRDRTRCAGDYLGQTPKATPVAQRMAADAGVDLRGLAGSGRAVRIVKAGYGAGCARLQPPAAPSRRRYCAVARC